MAVLHNALNWMSLGFTTVFWEVPWDVRSSGTTAQERERGQERELHIRLLPADTVDQQDGESGSGSYNGSSPLSFFVASGVTLSVANRCWVTF